MHFVKTNSNQTTIQYAKSTAFVQWYFLVPDFINVTNESQQNISRIIENKNVFIVCYTKRAYSALTNVYHKIENDVYLNKRALRCSQFQVDIQPVKTSIIFIKPHSFIQICDREEETDFIKKKKKRKKITKSDENIKL